MKDPKGTPNRLLQETSPYLQQHAYNPVDWYPWGQEALEKAKAEDKPILVSIGYSSCHWCHVMEKECFENDEVASLMNYHFINIKVDREERPDIDQIYMEAVQTMNIRGGWPLNVFLTPDGKPFYGGTYFPASHWEHLLKQIFNAFKTNRTQLEESAEEFTKVLNYSETHKYGLTDIESEFDEKEFLNVLPLLERQFDKRLGGMNKAPKFPMPSIYLLLLRIFQATGNTVALDHVKLTLDKMAFGGIYDQIGGGFARYSVDEEWFVPHFEKMLYDNAQLVSLYSEAYTLTKNELYKTIVEETINWLGNEMTSAEGGFYSALDADSEGVEGKYYVWSESEFNQILGSESELAKKYYNIQEHGNWEENVNILYRDLSDKEFAYRNNINLQDLEKRVKSWKEKLHEVQKKRVPPGLDDKCLASWNAMMLNGLIDAFRTFDNPQYLELALRNANFIEKTYITETKVLHTFNKGKASIDGYLEDYAFIIQAFINLYEATFQEKWINLAEDLTDRVIRNFYDPAEAFFFFTSSSGEKLIARKKEIFDNVIPASNSVMALNLYKLGLILENEEYSTIAKTMVGKMKNTILKEPTYLSNWGCVYYMLTKPTAEIAVSGKDFEKIRAQLDKIYYPNKVLCGTDASSSLPLLAFREAKGNDTMVYVCVNKTCKLPVKSAEEAILQLKELF